MPNWKIRFRLVFLPYLLITGAFTTLYTFLHWLFKIKLLWLEHVDETILEVWLPLGLPVVCYTIWLRRRFQIFTFKISYGDAVFRYLLVLSLLTGLLTAFLQGYMVREAGRLVHLKEFSEIVTKDRSQYYRIDDYFANENEARMFFTANTAGKYGQKLFYHCYIAVPLYDNAIPFVSDDTTSVRIRSANFWENYPDSLLITHNPLGWFGIHYSQELNNNLSRSDKDLKWKEFYLNSLDRFRNEKYNGINYFIRLANSKDYRQYAEAIRTTDNFERLAKPWIILEPKYSPFSNRQTISLKWLSVGFILQFVLFWFSLYIPKLNINAVDNIQAQEPSKDESSLIELLTPRKRYFATPIIVYLNIAVYVLMVITTGDVLGFESRDLLKWGANYGRQTTNGEWWRMITYGFIHANMYHLIFNMIGLIVAGLFLEPIVSTRQFAVVYILSIIAASAASLWWHIDIVSVGASGAIFGLYGMLVALIVTRSIKSRYWIQSLAFVSAYIGVQLLVGLLPGIDNIAHVGGLICGFLVGLTVSSKEQTSRG